MDDAPTPRWYHLTPNRAVVGLLAIEGFLILSERFDWFAFHQYKGWIALAGMASLGLAMFLMLLWFLAAWLFRRRFQFSMRSLLLLMVIVAIACSWPAEAWKQRQLAEEIANAGGRVFYDYQLDPSGRSMPTATPPGPPWLRKLGGDNLFATVTRLEVQNRSELGDTEMDAVRRFPQLQTLDLGWTKITDAGLAQLRGLAQLQELNLGGTKIGDAGLEHLQALGQLQILYLDGTKLSDAGLKNLAGLSRLQWLFLARTKIGDAGLRHLRGLTRLQGLDLGDAKVSAAGLEHLKGLTQLREIFLHGTKVTAAGAAELQ